MTRFRQTPKSEPNSNFPLLVCFNGAGMAPAWRRAKIYYARTRCLSISVGSGTAPEEAGVAVLAPNSRGNTWDAIGGSFGPDVKFLNRALELVIEILGNTGKCWRLMSAG